MPPGKVKARCLCEFEVVTQMTPENSEKMKTLIVACPPGKTVIGGGARIFGAAGNVALSASGPDGPPGAPTSWLATATEVGPGAAGNWGLRVDVFCAVVEP
jgi:hypothetical protein